MLRRPVCWVSPASTAENRSFSIPAAPPPKRHPYDQWSPDARALDLVGDKWTLLIIRDLAAGPRRFVELQRVLPGHLDRAAALAPQPDGRRRAAHAPALPRGPAARRLRADRALARPDAGARRARAVGLRLDVDRAARRRGRQRRRDLPPRARAARAAARARGRGRARRRGRGRGARAPLSRHDARRARRDRRARARGRRRPPPSAAASPPGCARSAPRATSTELEFEGNRGLADALLTGFADAARAAAHAQAA